MKEILGEWITYLNEGEQEYVLTFEQLESIFKVFHLSKDKLGDSEDSGKFTFTPRTPRSPLSGEDNFTQRISLAPNINRAVYALEMLRTKNTRLAQNYHVYAGDLKLDSSDDIDTVKLNIELRRCNKDLSYVDKVGKMAKYSDFYSKDRRWRYTEFVDKYIKDEFGVKSCLDIKDDDRRYSCQRVASELSRGPNSFSKVGREDIKQKFYACVPDASKTREEWSLEPVSLYYIGQKVMGENKVLVSPKMWQQLQSLLQKSSKKIKAKVYEDPEVFEEQKETEDKKIKYKTNKLSFFLETFKGIKQLRVPSWYLKDVYVMNDKNAIAAVAFDGWNPIGISTLSRSSSDELWGKENKKYGVVNLYVAPEYRGKGVASTLFNKVEKYFHNYDFIIGGRTTEKILIKKGYESTNEESSEIYGTIFKSKEKK